MATPRVKICGITNWTDARRACAAGADFLGFNFYRESPRYISPTRAAKIVSRLPQGVSAVGVFVNENEAAVLEIARTVGLEYVQLHGDESPQMVAHLARRVRVIKAVSVRKPFRTAELTRFKGASAFLLDGFDKRARGGTGKSFDWAVARRASRGRRIFLAGGLTEENAAEASRTAKPYALDVCSGVEASPGKKDAARLLAFMRALGNGKVRKR
jgi:phosphoribosylanthranilate isomerase